MKITCLKLGLSLAVVLILAPLAALHAEKPWVCVLTDISNEPDDEQSLVRFPVYANEYDVEGLVATTSTWLRSETREDLIRRQIEAYGQVRDNLARHAQGFPTKEHLQAVTCTGQTNYGMAAVGEAPRSPARGTCSPRRTRPTRVHCG